MTGTSWKYPAYTSYPVTSFSTFTLLHKCEIILDINGNYGKASMTVVGGHEQGSLELSTLSKKSLTP